MSGTADFDPQEALANARHEFGEHGGVNLSIEASTTFTVMHPEMMPELFAGHSGPAQGCYLYGRHFNPTVYRLGEQMAALEGTEAAYCTSSGMGAVSAAVLQLCAQATTRSSRAPSTAAPSRCSATSSASAWPQHDLRRRDRPLGHRARLHASNSTPLRRDVVEPDVGGGRAAQAGGPRPPARSQAGGRQHLLPVGVSPARLGPTWWCTA